MNKFILEQLNKTKINLPKYDNDTTEMIILKSNGATNLSADIQVGHWYSIFVEDYVVHPNANFTLADNWNQGTKPPESRLYAQILTINGKMVFVNSIGSTTEIKWGGWLPRKCFTVTEELYSGGNNV